MSRLSGPQAGPSSEDALQKLEELMKKTDYILEPKAWDVVLAYLKERGSPKTVISLLVDNYVGYAQMSSLVCKWQSLLCDPEDETSEQDEFYYLKEFIKSRFEPGKFTHVFTQSHHAKLAWLDGLLAEPRGRRLLYELSAVHRNSLLLNFAIQKIMKQGHEDEVASVGQSLSSYFSVSHKLLVSRVKVFLDNCRSLYQQTGAMRATRPTAAELSRVQRQQQEKQLVQSNKVASSGGADSAVAEELMEALAGACNQLMDKLVSELAGSCQSGQHTYLHVQHLILSLACHPEAPPNARLLLITLSQRILEAVMTGGQSLAAARRRHQWFQEAAARSVAQSIGGGGGLLTQQRHRLPSGDPAAAGSSTSPSPGSGSDSSEGSGPRRPVWTVNALLALSPPPLPLPSTPAASTSSTTATAPRPSRLAVEAASLVGSLLQTSASVLTHEHESSPGSSLDDSDLSANGSSQSDGADEDAGEDRGWVFTTTLQPGQTARSALRSPSVASLTRFAAVVAPRVERLSQLYCQNGWHAHARAGLRSRHSHSHRRDPFVGHHHGANHHHRGSGHGGHGIPRYGDGDDYDEATTIAPAVRSGSRGLDGAGAYGGGGAGVHKRKREQGEGGRGGAGVSIEEEGEGLEAEDERRQVLRASRDVDGGQKMRGGAREENDAGDVTNPDSDPAILSAIHIQVPALVDLLLQAVFLVPHGPFKLPNDPASLADLEEVVTQPDGEWEGASETRKKPRRLDKERGIRDSGSGASLPLVGWFEQETFVRPALRLLSAATSVPSTTPPALEALRRRDHSRGPADDDVDAYARATRTYDSGAKSEPDSATADAETGISGSETGAFVHRCLDAYEETYATLRKALWVAGVVLMSPGSTSPLEATTASSAAHEGGSGFDGARSGGDALSGSTTPPGKPLRVFDPLDLRLLDKVLSLPLACHGLLYRCAAVLCAADAAAPIQMYSQHAHLSAGGGGGGSSLFQPSHTHDVFVAHLRLALAIARRHRELRGKVVSVLERSLHRQSETGGLRGDPPVLLLDALAERMATAAAPQEVEDVARAIDRWIQVPTVDLTHIRHFAFRILTSIIPPFSARLCCWLLRLLATGGVRGVAAMHPPHGMAALRALASQCRDTEIEAELVARQQRQQMLLLQRGQGSAAATAQMEWQALQKLRSVAH